MKAIKILLIFFSIFIFGGCSNYIELNELAIVSSIGIEKEQDDYKITLEVIKEEKESSGSSSTKKNITFVGSGKSLDEAINSASLSSEKQLYFAHIEAILISEELASEGISNIMDYLSRNTDISFLSNVVLTKDDSPSDILNKKVDIKTEVIGDAINSIIESSEKNDSSYVSNKYIEFLDQYVNKYQDTYLPFIKVDAKKINITNLGIFKEDKLVGELSDLDTKTFSLLSNYTDSLLYRLSCEEEGYLVMRVYDGGTKIKVDDKKITININTSSEFNEVNCNISTDDKKYLSKFSKSLENAIKNDVESLLNTLKKYDSDILGLNNKIYKKYGKVEKDWKDYQIDIKVSNVSTKKGLLRNPIRSDYENN